MQHSPRFLNYTTDRVRRHHCLKVAEESIISVQLDQTNAVAVAVTLLNIDSDFAARVPGQHRKGNGPRAFDAKPRLSMSGFTQACVRRPPTHGARRPARYARLLRPAAAITRPPGLQRFGTRMQTVSA